MIRTKVAMVVCLLVSAGVRASEPPSLTGEPLAITIIWDASNSAGPQWPSFISICRQAISSSRRGDRVEIISAHAGRPKLRLSQTITAGDSRELESMYTVLQGITCPLLSDAHVEKAVEMADKRLRDAWASRSNSRAIVIVLTSGSLNEREVRAVCRAGEQFNKQNWQLYVVGAASTNRDLLIAANQGIVKWSLIEQASPTAWIKQLRELSVSTTTTESKRGPAVRESLRGSSIWPSNKTTTPPLGPTYAGPRQEDATIAIPGLFLPAFIVPEDKNSPQRPTDITPPSASSGKDAASTNRIEEPPHQPKPTEPNEPPSDKTKPATSIWTRIGPLLSSFWFWSAVAGVVVVTAVGLVLIRGNRQAMQWSSKVRAGIRSSNTKNDGVLTAMLNGKTHTLGKRSQIRTIHIGSAAENTIRIVDKDVSARHLCLYRKGQDLMAQNVGAKPITLNSISLKPKAKQRIVLPTVVELSPATRLTLDLQLPKASTPTTKEESHE